MALLIIIQLFILIFIGFRIKAILWEMRDFMEQLLQDDPEKNFFVNYLISIDDAVRHCLCTLEEDFEEVDSYEDEG